MLLNQFSVRVAEGAEQDGYVELTHGQEYSLHLRNMNSVPCDAEVEIDGKSVGAFRINAQSSMLLERPQNDKGRFTFAALGTKEAEQGQLNPNSPDLGLIKVTFTPGRVKQVRPVFESKEWRGQEGAAYAGADPRTLEASYSPSNPRGAGGTVLSGHSNQQFTSVEQLDYDYTRQTVIHLRLVSRGTIIGGVRPLTSSTPIPPRIG